MSRVLATILGTVVLAGCLFLAPHPGGAAPPAAASPAASAETTSCPAPQRIVKLALGAERAARHARAEWARAKRCLGERARLQVLGRPDRDESAVAWLSAMDTWSRQHRDFDRRLAKLMHRMRAPGGTSCGSRWKPLMRWLKYPERIIPTFVYIIQRESSGRVRAVNPSSGCAGLLQFQPAWFRGQWGYPAFDPFDPEQNLKAGLWVWQREGLAPWAL